VCKRASLVQSISALQGTALTARSTEACLQHSAAHLPRRAAAPNTPTSLLHRPAPQLLHLVARSLYAGSIELDASNVEVVLMVSAASAGSCPGAASLPRASP
jgi:hypothetical protein